MAIGELFRNRQGGVVGDLMVNREAKAGALKGGD